MHHPILSSGRWLLILSPSFKIHPMSKEIELEISNGVAVLTVNRPNSRNALNWNTQQQFADAINSCAADDAVRVLIITGAGNTFIAGGDIKDHVDEHEPETGRRLGTIMGGALRQMTEMPKPVIAAINGPAYGGGCEIITACDLRIMAASAKLQFVQAKMGLTTGWGGAARLIHLVGASRALEFLLTTAPIDARTALNCGLATRVSLRGDSTLEVALEEARRLLILPSSSLGALKQLVWESADLERGYSAEKRHFLNQWSHPHHAEAVNAFIEKRPPNFS